MTFHIPITDKQSVEKTTLIETSERRKQNRTRIQNFISKRNRIRIQNFMSKKKQKKSWKQEQKYENYQMLRKLYT